MIKYLYDDNGNTTDAIIPIADWNTIYADKSYNLTSTKYIGEEPINKESIFFQHYIEILDLVDKHIVIDNITKNELYSIENKCQMLNINDKYELLSNEIWLKQYYKKYFKYYEILNEDDISLLYFFRTNIFKNFDINDNIEVHIDKLYSNYKLTNYLNAGKISIQEYNILVSKFNQLTEFSFLQFFRINFKINLPYKKNIRLNRDSECNRLFIYDLLTINKSYSNYDELKKYNNIIAKKSNLIEFLFNFIYNGNKTQVYRAYKEAKEKIQSLII